MFPDSDFSLGGIDSKKHHESSFQRAQLKQPRKNKMADLAWSVKNQIFQNLSCSIPLEAKFDADHFLQKHYGPKMNRKATK